MTRSKRKTRQRPTHRRYRPLGLSIAILATAGLYGIWPLIPVLMLVWINARGHSFGGEFQSPLAWSNAVLGFITLVASVIAWIGRPPWSRWVLIALVILATVLRLVQIGTDSLAKPTAGAPSGGNLSSVTQPLSVCQGLLLIFIPLYIIWYMNRAPARAFYRQDQILDSDA